MRRGRATPSTAGRSRSPGSRRTSSPRSSPPRMRGSGSTTGSTGRPSPRRAPTTSSTRRPAPARARRLDDHAAAREEPLALGPPDLVAQGAGGRHRARPRRTASRRRRILELYLSAIEWGERTYGCEAAARALFGVPASRLTAAQAAKMAAMIPSPVWYRAHPAAWERRAGIVANAWAVRARRRRPTRTRRARASSPR